MDWDTIKNELNERVQKWYAVRKIMVEPTYPRVLIWLLPKQQKVGRIWTPDYKANKPTAEGIVLAVYKPFWKLVDVARRLEGKKPEITTKSEWKEAPVYVGDHILFPHIAEGITPVWPLDGGVGEFRMVPDYLILAKLRTGDAKVNGVPLRDWLANQGKNLEYGLPDSDYYGMADEILANTTVIPKCTQAVTLSGV